MSYSNFKLYCEYGFYEEARDIIREENLKLYLKVCEEFGVKNPAELLVVIPRKYVDYFGCTSFWGKDMYNLDHIRIEYPLGLVRNDPAVLYGDIIPHEIAHAVIAQIYPELGEKVGHGKLWQELAEYIGAIPEAEYPYPDSRLKCIVEHEEK